MKYLTILFTLFALQTSVAAQEKVEANPTANSVNSVIDRVAEKLGSGFELAKENIKPLAEETVRQYVARNMFMSVAWLCGLVFFLILVVVGLILFLTNRPPTGNEDVQFIGCALLVVGLLMIGVSVGLTADLYANALSPYIELLHMLR